MAEARLARLDRLLRALHGAPRPARLSALHRVAAATLPDPAARRFHLTHAWIFALEAGDDPLTEALETDLRAVGGL
jgi:hypothetical protein